MVKRISSIILTIALLICMFPAAYGNAAEDSNVKYIVQPVLEYDQVHYFSNGLASVSKDRKYGYIDRTGKEVITPKYDWAGIFAEGMAFIQTGSKYGYINTSGKEVVPPTYDFVDYRFSEGVSRVQNGGKWGFVDTTGKLVVPLIYDMEFYSTEGLIAVNKGSKWGYIDKTGKVIIPLIYDETNPFSDGVGAVRKGKKYMYIDKTGKVICEPVTLSNLPFVDGLALAIGNGLFGYINKTGKLVAPTIYRMAYPSSEGLASALGDNGYVYLDKTGKVVISGNYNGAGEFSEGAASIGIYDKTVQDIMNGYIDKTGKIIVKPIYNEAFKFSEGLGMVVTGNYDSGRYGFVDKTGKEIIPLIYESGTQSSSEGLIVVKKDGKWGIIENPVLKVPSAPSGLSATLNNGSVTLKWNSVDNATAYRVYQQINSTGKYNYKEIGPTKELKATINNLKNGVSYTYVVCAYNVKGNGPYSSAKTITPISAPTLGASAGAGKAVLSWNKVSGAAGYKVYSVDNNGTYVLVTDVKSNNTFTKTGLTKGKTYKYAVVSYNSSGQTDYSNVVSVIVK